MNTQVNVPVGNITNRMTLDVTVTGVRIWRVRTAIAVALLKLGAFVLGTKCEVSIDLR